jgi:hypothetical protein
MKVKQKCRHFDTMEVIEAESDAALNALAEHDFEDALKKWQGAVNVAYSRKGTSSRLLAGIGHKVGF